MIDEDRIDINEGTRKFNSFDGSAFLRDACHKRKYLGYRLYILNELQSMYAQICSRYYWPYIFHADKDFSLYAASSMIACAGVQDVIYIIGILSKGYLTNQDSKAVNCLREDFDPIIMNLIRFELKRMGRLDLLLWIEKTERN